MQKSLSTSVKEWMAEPKDPNTRLRVHYISSNVAKFILDTWKKNPNCDLRINGQLVDILNKYDYRIRRVGSDVKSSIVPNTNVRYVCYYGTRHPNGESCECQKTYQVFYWDFMEYMRKRFKVSYAYDITKSMQDEFLREKSLVK